MAHTYSEYNVFSVIASYYLLPYHVLLLFRFFMHIPPSNIMLVIVLIMYAGKVLLRNIIFILK